MTSEIPHSDPEFRSFLYCFKPPRRRTAAPPPPRQAVGAFGPVATRVPMGLDLSVRSAECLSSPPQTWVDGHSGTSLVNALALEKFRSAGVRWPRKSPDRL